LINGGASAAQPYDLGSFKPALRAGESITIELDFDGDHTFSISFEASGHDAITAEYPIPATSKVTPWPTFANFGVECPHVGASSDPTKKIQTDPPSFKVLKTYNMTINGTALNQWGQVTHYTASKLHEISSLEDGNSFTVAPVA